METHNPRTKIFIQNITSKLGYYLVQTLRNDHKQLQNYSLIVGSTHHTNKKQSYHPSIHATVNFKNNQDLLSKCVLESNIVIVDATEASEQVEFIVKLISQKCQYRQQMRKQGKQAKQQKLCVIGIGSHMTWAYEKPNISKFESQKQQNLNKFLNYDPEKQQKIQDNSKSLRVPHHHWVRQNQIQKNIVNLNKFKDVKSCILTTGIFYGKNFPSIEIEDLVSRCFSLCDQVSIYGDGNNILPTVYIQDFCQHFEYIRTQLQQNRPHNKYYISVDQKLHTQLQIVQNLLKNSGYVKQIKKHQLVYLTKQQAFYSESVFLQKSQIFKSLQNQCPSICRYFEQKYEEISEYVELEPVHYVIYGHEIQADRLEQLENDLSTVIQVFKQSDISNQLCKKKKVTKQQLDIHELNRMIEQNIIDKHDRQNYVLILSSNLFDTSTVRKYKLKKFQIQADAAYLLKHKYHKYANMDTAGSETAKIQQTKTNNKEQDQQIIQNLLQVQVQKQAVLPQQLEKQRKSETTDTYALIEQKRRQIQKKQYRKYDQFLLDNVIGYVSQAIFNVSKQSNGDLGAFVAALKDVYNRELIVQGSQAV